MTCTNGNETETGKELITRHFGLNAASEPKTTWSLISLSILLLFLTLWLTACENFSLESPMLKIQWHDGGTNAPLNLYKL